MAVIAHILKSNLKFLWWIIVIMLVNACYLSAQKNIEISGGAGFPESVNLKLKYGNHNKVGIGIGYIPDFLETNNNISLTLDFHHYFKEKNDTIRSKWYYNGGISYWPYKNDRFLFLFLRFGRSIMFSERAGINVDLGLAGGEEWESRYIGSIAAGGLVPYKAAWGPYPMPAFGVSFFVRF